jgi:hypothetical protein
VRDVPPQTNKTLQQILGRFKVSISVTIFVAGIAIMSISTGRQGAWWQLVSNLGVFVAAAVAIPFYYELVLRDAERSMVRDQLSQLLDERLDPQGNRCIVHTQGRLPVSEKRAFIQTAQSEVCEVGIALRSLVSYFDQRPEQDFLEPVRQMLAKGINFTYILLDPESDAAAAYSRDTNDPDLQNRIRQSINRLTEIGTTLAANKSAGQFNVGVTKVWPSSSVIITDPDGTTGRALVSPYLLGIKRASTPVLEVSKKEHPDMFDKYAAHWRVIASE